MSILHLATNTMIQSRMTVVSGSKQAFATVTAVRGALQPLTKTEAELYNGVFGVLFQFFCDGGVDIQEGDRLKDENGVYYRVEANGVNRRVYGSIDYLKVICQRL